MSLLLRTSFLFLVTAVSLFAAAIEGQVLSVNPESRTLEVKLTSSASAELPKESTQTFRVGLGDIAIGYKDRLIRAEAVNYGNRWNLEQIFPLDGIGAKAAKDVNHQLHQATATMQRRDYMREGDYIPNFAMIDQNGEFLQIRQLQGKAFVLNFIFTRCTVPKMCPASSTRMSELQELVSEAQIENLEFVTITFDPLFDSPGILKQYAEGYGLEGDNFHLLTNSDDKVVDDLLRQFGILTMEEDGTINHTMATFLIDAKGRVAYRKEGSSWSTDEFLDAAKKL